MRDRRVIGRRALAVLLGTAMLVIAAAAVLLLRTAATGATHAALRLTEGGCDLLIAYHHASQPLQLSPDRYEMLTLGTELLAPFAKPDENGLDEFGRVHRSVTGPSMMSTVSVEPFCHFWSRILSHWLPLPLVFVRTKVS